jgi:hypothetical protein
MDDARRKNELRVHLVAWLPLLVSKPLFVFFRVFQVGRTRGVSLGVLQTLRVVLDISAKSVIELIFVGLR